MLCGLYLKKAVTEKSLTTDGTWGTDKRDGVKDGPGFPLWWSHQRSGGQSPLLPARLVATGDPGPRSCRQQDTGLVAEGSGGL